MAEPLDGGVSERAKVRNTAGEAHEWAGIRRMPLGLLMQGRKPRSVVFLLDGKPVGTADGLSATPGAWCRAGFAPLVGHLPSARAFGPVVATGSARRASMVTGHVTSPSPDGCVWHRMAACVAYRQYRGVRWAIKLMEPVARRARRTWQACIGPGSSVGRAAD